LLDLPSLNGKPCSVRIESEFVSTECIRNQERV
jgi:hypothetical protein